MLVSRGWGTICSSLEWMLKIHVAQPILVCWKKVIEVIKKLKMPDAEKIVQALRKIDAKFATVNFNRLLVNYIFYSFMNFLPLSFFMCIFILIFLHFLIYSLCGIILNCKITCS